MCMRCTVTEERWHKVVWLEGGPNWMVGRCPHSPLNPSLVLVLFLVLIKDYFIIKRMLTQKASVYPGFILMSVL